MSLTETVETWLEDWQLLQDGDTVLAACSGGPDSLALLHILHRLQGKYRLRLSAAHVDHMIRGDASAADAEFVEQFCQSLGVPLFRTALDVPAYVRETGRSAEEAGRILRYRFLRAVAGELGGAKIATGHHRDDQAETVLLHLLRGAGLEGLAAMRPEENGIIRPLLGSSRREIEAYCREMGLAPREDLSNRETHYTRNKVRLELLPILETYNPAVREALCRTAALAAEQQDYLLRQTSAVWPQLTRQSERGLFLDAAAMLAVHPALRRSLLRMAVEKKLGSLTGISFVHVENLMRMLVERPAGSCLCLPRGLRARRTYEGLELYQAAEKPDKPPPAREWPLTIPGETVLPEWAAAITAVVVDRTEWHGENGTAVFDWNAVKPPLTVRSRRAGDRFLPLGMTGSKKLKDFFIDAKVPRDKRDFVPLVCDRQGILWVVGYRQAELAKATRNTTHFLRLTARTQAAGAADGTE